MDDFVPFWGSILPSSNISLLILDFCYECLDGDYDIANVLRPNSDYWASNLKEDDDNVPVDIILNLRASYQLSGFYIELGSGLIPEKIEIFKMFEGDTEVFPLHVIDFTGSCKTPDFIDSGRRLNLKHPSEWLRVPACKHQFKPLFRHGFMSKWIRNSQ